MTRLHRLWIGSHALVVACGCMVVSAVAGAQLRLNKEEALQMYAAAGFRVVNDQPTNRCGKPAKPRVTFVDLNADRMPEAVFVDGDPSCYGFSGRYFAVLVKDGATWRLLVHGNGTVQPLKTRTSGWLDLRATDGGCARDHRYDGVTYKAAAACNESVAAAPQGTQAPQSSSAAPLSAQSAQSPATASSAAPSPQPAPVPSKLTAADEAAAFKAAGLKKRGSLWHECDEPNVGASLEGVGDLNGDGLPEAVIIEAGGTVCYGNTGQAFWLVSKQRNGSWKLMTNAIGIAEFLKSKGANGWPDVSIGGPGLCFPVRRWNGTKYVLHRSEYEGKPCKI